MGQFLDPLAITITGPTSQIVELTGGIRYKDDNGKVYPVPEGFKCDLASVPKWLQSLAPPWEQSGRAGVLHDCGYRWEEVWHLGKKKVDDLFYEGLRADGVGRFSAKAMQLAVRMFGKKAWDGWRTTPEQDKGVQPGPVV